jgi:hypothetical protein
VQDLRDHIAEGHSGLDFMSGRLAQQRLDGLQVIKDALQLAGRPAERVVVREASRFVRTSSGALSKMITSKRGWN